MDKTTILIDQRWTIADGAGRFAAHTLFQYPNSQKLTGNIKPTHPLDCIWLMWKLLCLQPKLYISPMWNVPLWTCTPLIITVHDLAFVDSPEQRTLIKSLYFNYIFRRIARKNCQLIFTVSEYTRQRLISWLSIAPEKIVCVPNAVSDNYTIDGNKHDAGAPYLLYVSNRAPHKNEYRLIEAFENANLPANFKLLLTGKSNTDRDTLIKKFNLMDRVEYTGFIAEEKMADYYRGAHALIFPSLHEGFGIPPLEAMACGIPVAVSNVTAMPEVCQNAALYFDPRNLDSISQAMEEISLNTNLRQTLRENGFKRIQDFSWEKSKQQAHHEIDKILKALSKKDE